MLYRHKPRWRRYAFECSDVQVNGVLPNTVAQPALERLTMALITKNMSLDRVIKELRVTGRF